MELPRIVTDMLPYIYLTAVLPVGYILGIIFSRLLRFSFRRFESDIRKIYKRYLRQPIRILVTLAAMSLVIAIAGFPEGHLVLLKHALRILFIIDGVWILLGGLHVVEAYLTARLHLDSEDNLYARKIYTQLGMLRRIAAFVVLILGFGILLTTFDSIRQLGTTLLASAGIVGIILGVAAQKTIGLVLAGLQVAFTQPIRIDDVVIVEDEWGRIEEIALTYVVVRIWDERRLVLPISYFIETPFQNWTRSSSKLIGSVYLYADYTLPVSPLREELTTAVSGFPEWDGRVQVIQVTGTTERSQEIRILVSARNAPQLWDLRCAVREHMIGFIQNNYPEALPKLRAQLDPSTNEPG